MQKYKKNIQCFLDKEKPPVIAGGFVELIRINYFFTASSTFLAVFTVSSLTTFAACSTS
jgi:hypothetical protein